uniref:Uncharacterized protein n=1 Tax=Caenorhabditis japonica TaxID=281687 RepID=A0A8R1IPI0_CAEJA
MKTRTEELTSSQTTHGALFLLQQRAAVTTSFPPLQHRLRRGRKTESSKHMHVGRKVCEAKHVHTTC